MDSELKKHLETVKYDGLLLKEVPSEYRANKQVIRAAIVRKFKDYYWDDNLYCVEMFEVLKAFQFADEKLRNDKKFVLSLIEKCSGYLFPYLPELLRSDEEVYLKAIERTGLSYVYSELHKCENRNFSVDGSIYSIGLEDYLMNHEITGFAGSKIRSNKKIMLFALSKEPGALMDLDDKFKDDKNIVLASVSKCGYLLKFASERLRDDNKIVMAAIYATCQVNLMEDFTGEEYWHHATHVEWEYISDRLKSDKDLYLEIIKDSEKYYRGEFVLKLAPESIKDNEEVLLAALAITKDVLKYASERLQEKFSNF